MLTFRIAEKKDLIIIHQIAQQTWFITYQSFISQAQIDFMFEKMYTLDALEEQMILEKNNFIIALFESTPCGFLAYKIVEGEPLVKVPKLYVLPYFQGKKIGALLLDKLMEIAKQNNKCFIQLNVNRNNPAIQFYLKMGFSITQTVDIPYYNFVLNDFVLQKTVC